MLDEWPEPLPWHIFGRGLQNSFPAEDSNSPNFDAVGGLADVRDGEVLRVVFPADPSMIGKQKLKQP